MKKINVVGTSGSGKSTFSRLLAARLHYPHIEMDALFWQPNWTESTDERFFAILAEQLACPHWVLDGNYHRTLAIKWAEVDTVIWLDYSLARTCYQAIKRAFSRSMSGRELWPGTGNVETFSKSFFSRSSVINWTLKTHGSNRQRYVEMMHAREFEHIRFIHLRTPRAARAFLDNPGSIHQRGEPKPGR